MAGYDQYDDSDDEGRDPRRAIARRSVVFPAFVLVLFGTVGLIVELTTLIAAAQQPTALADWMNDWVEAQPPGRNKDEFKRLLREAGDDTRLDTPLQVGGSILGAFLGLLIIAGGIAMRSLGSYGLALTGAIAALIPLGGCCCCSLPVGLWALIVLQRSDVKAAFGPRARNREDGY